MSGKDRLIERDYNGERLAEAAAVDRVQTSQNSATFWWI